MTGERFSLGWYCRQSYHVANGADPSHSIPHEPQGAGRSEGRPRAELAFEAGRGEGDMNHGHGSMHTVP